MTTKTPTPVTTPVTVEFMAMAGQWVIRDATGRLPATAEIAAALNAGHFPPWADAMVLALVEDELRQEQSAEQAREMALDVIDGMRATPIAAPLERDDWAAEPRYEGRAEGLCPFCDGTGDAWSTLRAGYATAPDDPDARGYWVACRSCGATGGWSKALAGALRLWGLRPKASTEEAGDAL